MMMTKKKMMMKRCFLRGGAGITVSEASKEQNVDDLMKDDANEEKEEVDGKGEHVGDQNVDQVEKDVFRHIYTMNEILMITHGNEAEFKSDFEKELNAFDINHQPEYEYKYVEDADMYDRVEVEDCSDEEDVSEDTSQFPSLMEFFTEESRDELRRKVDEILKDKNFEGTSKDSQKEDHKKWFKDSHERKFKRPLKYYQRDRSISLGDIISWGFLPQVNAYAVRRECGLQYFKRLYDIMSLPWWDVEEFSKVRTQGYPVRENNLAMWGFMKFEALRDFQHWKPHYPKKVRRKL
ncbi:hypothetical protein Hanom_Chr04g00328251 [Helianthus anomalus]